MIVRATADKGRFKKGVEYDLSEAEARAAIIAGTVTFIAVAPQINRDKAIIKKYETR